MAEQEQDPRHIVNGNEIPSKGYCDQPYIVINDDGSWTCVMTTGEGKEGQGGQHIVATITTDKGETWSDLYEIEPPTGPEASWAQPLRTPDGRIYVFYTYNKDNMREAISDSGTTKRVDSLGAMAYKYSDDCGKTWSRQRYYVPIRTFEIDRENPYGGDVHFFWGVSKPFIMNGEAYVFASKVGRFGDGFMARSEGMLLHSPNLLNEHDAEKHEWETLPDGDIGLRSPIGPVSDEHNGTPMADGSIYCTYRTIAGYPCHAYSRDGGHSFTEPAFMTYTPDGRYVKNPRAANFVRRFSNGKYIYWFENHGGEVLRQEASSGALFYNSRNPAWIAGGVEKNGYIHWSEPEIVLFDDDPGMRMSYPDFIEQDGRYFFSETQKSVARIHEISPDLLEGMWRQGEDTERVTSGLICDLDGKDCANGATAEMPALPKLIDREGFSLDFRVRFDELTPFQKLFDTRDKAGRGILLMGNDRGQIQVTFAGHTCSPPAHARSTWRAGICECSWTTDYDVITAGKEHHVTFIVDGGPKLITVVVDGMLNDGGQKRQYGWGRVHPYMRDANGAPTCRFGETLQGELRAFRLYNRYLRTSEAIANFHADKKGA